jgi:lysocardiolipin and lysophospholipid acyltransferase
MYFRRWATSSIPLEDPKAFEAWIMGVWREKEALLDYFYKHGRFPANESAVTSEPAAEVPLPKQMSAKSHIETEIKLSRWVEVAQIFIVLAAVALVANVGVKTLGLVAKMGVS